MLCLVMGCLANVCCGMGRFEQSPRSHFVLLCGAVAFTVTVHVHFWGKFSVILYAAKHYRLSELLFWVQRTVYVHVWHQSSSCYDRYMYCNCYGIMAHRDIRLIFCSKLLGTVTILFLKADVRACVVLRMCSDFL